MNLLGPVMVDVDGVELTDEDRLLLLNPLVGGVILFTRNFESLQQLKKLINDIKQLRSPSLLIAVDHEGGRVQRFKDPFTVIPALSVLGKKYDSEQETALHHAEIFGWLTASELLAFNIDFSFTPVLDIDFGFSQVIGDRSFHHSATVIAKLAANYIKGMHRAGMASTGKHFPGHGGVSADSHTDIPVDHRSFEEIHTNDLLPYKELIPEHLDAIMPAHVIYNKVTDDPAGFSLYWLKTILREELNFKGIIFSDDLDMKGASYISDDYSVRAETALNAGCDMVLVCNNRVAAMQVVEKLNYNVSDQSSDHLLKMRGTSTMPAWEVLIKQDNWQQAVNIISEYNQV